MLFRRADRGKIVPATGRVTTRRLRSLPPEPCSLPQAERGGGEVVFRAGVSVCTAAPW